MFKVLKRISTMLVFVITLITCSACFSSSSDDSPHFGPVELVSTDPTTTVRFMNEGLYIGYLGAQRDFALIVDNAGYTLANQIQGCGTGQGDDVIGCSSTMAKLLMNYGIKTSNYLNTSGSENLLLYYTTSTDFDSFGAPDEENGSWYDHLTGVNFESEVTAAGINEYEDFAKDTNILSLSCGTQGISHSYICNYSKDMSTKGYSSTAGNAMILLFNQGDLYTVITDARLDTKNELNYNDTKLDDLVVNNSMDQKSKFTNYYSKIVDSLRTHIKVSNSTNLTASTQATLQEINVLNSLNDLDDLVSGRDGVKDYLLLITSDGFITPKVGTNQYQDGGTGDYIDDTQEDGQESSPALNSLKLLLNSISVYTDNCAVESTPMLNFLKSILQMYLAGTIGSLVGAGALAGVGAGIGALVGSIVPGIGTAVGAGVGAGIGALVGAIAGFFAGIAVNNSLEEKLKSANGISDISYCKIVESALTDIEINVPIYTYNINTATENVHNYINSGLSDSRLNTYYNSHITKCVNQHQRVAVPSGLLSFLTSELDDNYAYADACEVEMVKDIVNDFGGSPSLQLYLNGHRTDDLFGRVTTELVNEMLYVWGLKTLGSLYSLATNGSLNDMSVTFASAQALSSIKYCISESKLPDCSGLTSKAIIPSNDNYIATFKKEDGIKVDITNDYKSFSSLKTAEWFTDTKINQMVLQLPEGTENKDYYRKRLAENEGWGRVPAIPTEPTDTLLSAIKEKLKTDDGMYQISYKNIKYILCSDGSMVGYIDNKYGVMEIVYYIDAEYEYIFSKLPDTVEYGNYLISEVKANSSTQVDAAHEFYVYIEYTIASSGETGYYSYIV